MLAGTPMLASLAEIEPNSGGCLVRIFDGATGTQLSDPQDSFFAFDPLFAGGVFVGASS